MSVFSTQKLNALLRTQALGRGETLYWPVTDSTNKVLKAMAADGAPHGSLAVCDAQTAGRGRLTRAWYAPAEASLLCSLLLEPFGGAETLPLYTLCAAAAMARALGELCPDLPVRIKWPNDLLIGRKKLCGILCEAITGSDGRQRVIVGIGLNVHEDVFPAELDDRAVSLRMALDGHEPDRESCLSAFLWHMEQVLDTWEQGGFEALRGLYEPLCATLGWEVRVLAPAETWCGTAETIGDDGRLRVRAADGMLRDVTCGDVSIRGMFGYADDEKP